MYQRKYQKMKVVVLNREDSVLNSFLAEIRDVDVQKDPLRFRHNVERIGWMMAYEVSKIMNYATYDVVTPLGVAPVSLPQDPIVVGSILRAGVPMHQGVLDVFDRSENSFISAYRQYSSDDKFDIHIEYVATPNLDGKILLLNDPMLATGCSLELTYKALKRYGTPKHVHIMSIIGSNAGVDYLCKALEGEPVTLWIAAVDPELNSHKYIVPGLGDAGDLAYGEKCDVH